MTKKEESQDQIIIKSFADVITRLDKQIDSITLRQQELQNYIIMIDNHISHFDQMIQRETQKPSPDYKKIAGYRSASFKNIELMTTLHNTYKEYEGVKFRYFKEISDNNFKQQKLVHVDVKRVGTTEEMGSEFYSIMRNLSKLNIVGDEARTQISENNKMLDAVKSGFNNDEFEM